MLITFLFCVPLIVIFALIVFDAPSSLLSLNQRLVLASSFLIPVLLIPFISVYIKSRRTIKRSGLEIDEDTLKLPSGEHINFDTISSITFFPDENRIFFTRNNDEQLKIDQLVQSLEKKSRRFKSLLILFGTLIASTQAINALEKIKKMEVEVPCGGVMNKKELRKVLKARFPEEVNKRTITQILTYRKGQPIRTAYDKGR